MSLSAPEKASSDLSVFDEYKDRMYRYFGDLAPELKHVQSPQELYDALNSAATRSLDEAALAEEKSPLQDRLKRRGDTVIPTYMKEVVERFEGVKA